MAKELVLPEGYEAFLADLKTQVRTARVRASLQANSELIKLYWTVGKKILERQETAQWGDKLLERLANDLRREFPDMRGFSTRNLKYMRSFAQTYPDAIGQRLVAQLPWGQNIILMTKVKDPTVRDWYAHACFESGWTRPTLEMKIESKLYERQGQAVTNFSKTLPPLQSDLARQILKDPYTFDFLGLGDEALEREIERGLLGHLKKFMLELGVGFAFLGDQYHLEVGGQDFYIDLLFYHVKLHCYVVIELKARDFQPEDAGQMSFYLSAVDGILREKEDKPTIGLLLCKGKNKVIAEYALQGINQPLGVSEYQLVEALPKNLEADLPTVEKLEAELARLEEREEE
jgi:predicted nuclease of restriction endonuclease-like (RecB) superfamily